MEAFGIRILVAPTDSAELLGFVLLGVVLGTVSGLTPGIHANNFALLLAAGAAAIPGPPLLLGVAMLAAGVVHTFLDVVPAIAFGVPDADMFATALPGHQLVLLGNGREALRLSALGSGLAVLAAIPLAVPITYAMVQIYPTLYPHMSVLLLGVAGFLVITERSLTSKIGAIIAFAGSAVLGATLLDITPNAPLDGGGMIAPLLAGLFGAPILLDSLTGKGIPAQPSAVISVSPSFILLTAVAGTIAGAIVGYLPGISSAIAAIIILTLYPKANGPRGFIIATSGVNTANTIFALFALVALGSPRTGVLVALDQTGVPLNLPVLLLTIACAAAIGFVLVWKIGDHYLRIVGQINYTRLGVAIFIGLILTAFAFAGKLGLLAFSVSAVFGMIPPRMGARRVNLMGVLIGPIVLT